MSLLTNVGAAALFFFAADLVYTLDHYFVHHDASAIEPGTLDIIVATTS